MDVIYLRRDVWNYASEADEIKCQSRVTAFNIGVSSKNTN